MKTTQVFDERNAEKQKLHFAAKRCHPYPREIWYVKVGSNIGYESDGKENFMRPILVIKKMGNLYFCLSMTTKGKKNKFYHQIESIDFGKKSFITLSQGKVFDSKRFIERIGKIGQEEFVSIKKLVQDMYIGQVL